MPESPTGTVTFLFTDIEGSTRRWDQQSDAMRIALARHDTILRSSIEAHGGHIFKTVGDGFYGAFATAPDALAAALEAQRALTAESWGESGEVRVRMALHTGAVQHRDGDYFGQAPNRVSRLLNTGHGGQTLLSLATQELVRDQLPEGVQLCDLGLHRLRDLIRPEEIFQVVAPPLQVDFPPLKTLDARPHNLQIQPTPLIGREREVAQICARLRREEVRLLTLTGPGGTGKTRVGLQVAADLLDDYKDGVYFVALAPLSEPALVVSTIAQTLSVKESGGRSIMESLQDYLREKSLLLALDNFEQVTTAAPQVAELLANSPRLNVLVTSRVPLHLRGEHEIAVPPLALPDCKHLPALAALSQYAAVELFIERARAVKAEFRVDNDNAPAVAEICVRLDGLPLAIELAAARIKLLAPQAMLRRLKEPLRFLTGGACDLSARQQTLRGAIAWSYDLLNETEKRLFRRLAIFVGGCTLEAAETVCNSGGDSDVDVFDGVASLLDKSLLRLEEAHDGEPRFFMLETVREYASERLRESNGTDEIQRRHAQFFLAFAEQGEIGLQGAKQLQWLDRLEIEHDNLRAALDWSIQTDEVIPFGLRIGGALARFWRMRGHITEGRAWLTRLLELTGASARTPERAKALCGVGSLVVWLFHQQKFALRCLEESVAIWREIGDKRELALSLAYLALATFIESHRSAGIALAEESAALSLEGEDQWGSALSMWVLGVLAWWQGELIRARAIMEKCINANRRLGDKAGLAWALDVLSGITFDEGDSANARRLAEESLALNRELGDDLWTADGLQDLARMAFREGHYKSAREYREAALAIDERLGNKAQIAVSLFALARFAHYDGDEITALTLCERSLAAARESSNKDALIDLLYGVGRIALDQGEYRRARTLYDESLAIVGEMEDLKNAALPFMGLGDLTRVQGEEPNAWDFYEKSLDAARACGNEKVKLEILRQIGDMALDQCAFARARLLRQERLAIHRRSGHKLAIAWSLHGLAQVAHYSGEFVQALALLEECMPIFRELGQGKGIAFAQCGIGDAAYVQGDFGRARDLFEQGIARVRKLPDITDLASPLGRLARVACAEGDHVVALAALREGMSISQHTRDKRGIAEGLAGFAKIARAQDDAERAARLFGAAESLHKILGPRLSPLDHHDHAGVVATLRSALGEEAFAAGWAEGRAMTREEAVAYALEESKLS